MGSFQKCHKFDQVSCAKALIAFHSSYNVLSLFLKRRSGLLELFPYGLGGPHVLYFFLQLAVGSCDLSQAENEITVVTSLTYVIL